MPGSEKGPGREVHTPQNVKRTEEPQGEGETGEVKLDEGGGHENVGCQTARPGSRLMLQVHKGRGACDQRPAP
jgi:hypothetical protein